MKKNTRDRLVLPILIPVLGLIGIALVTILISQVLLTISAEGATFVALMVGATVVMAGALVARSKKVAMGSLALIALITLGMAAFAGGVVLAAAGPRPEEHKEEPIEGVELELVAKDIAFEPTELTAPVGEYVLINFDNQDAATQHNVQLFGGPEVEGDAIYDGELITGPAKIQYTIEPFEEAGTFAFICVVHPNMEASLVIGETAGDKPADGTGDKTTDKPEKPTDEPAGEPSAPPATASIPLIAPAGAVSSGFEETALTASADAPFTIAFDNQDPGVPHNVVIAEGVSSDGTQVFAPPGGETDGVTGPGTADYKVAGLPAGTYVYYCFFHPTTMTGTLTVS